MNALTVRLVSLALFAALCATATYWLLTLTSHDATPLAAAAPNRTPESVNAAVTLFGSKAGAAQVSDIHLSGILMLREGAAAIVSYGNDPARAVSLNNRIADGIKLVDVRARSIIVERNGTRSEIYLPQMPAGSATIYVR
jgi:general secretion pathway protein C